MVLYGYHGVHLEERKLGGLFEYAMWVEADTREADELDELSGTIDYTTCIRICEEENAIGSQLLEHVSERIIQRVLSSDARIREVYVRIDKLRAPIGRQVGSVYVEKQKKRG